MRITDAMTNSMLNSYLVKNKAAVYEIQQQTSSGVKVAKPSDGAGAYDRVISMRYTGTMIDQYQANSNRLQGDLLDMDAQLQKVQDQILRASEIVTSGGDGTKNPQDLVALGEEIDQILEDIAVLANSKNDGSSVYSGLRQDVDAYVVERNAEGHITAVTYQGSDETRKVEIAEGDYLSSTLVGSDVNSTNGIFQTSETDVFAHLINIRDRLMEGKNLAEPESFTVDPAADTLTVAGIYATGSSVTLESTESLPAGLSADTAYYVIRVSDTEIQLADSLANARAGIAIDLTDSGSGTLEITQTAAADMERDEEQIVNVLSRLGAYEERLKTSISALSKEESNLQTKLEKEESVDVAEAVTELYEKQAAYEAAMKVTSAAFGTSLLDYI